MSTIREVEEAVRSWQKTAIVGSVKLFQNSKWAVTDD